MAVEPKVIDAGKPVGGGRQIKRRHLTQFQRNQASQRTTERLRGAVKERVLEKQHGHKITEGRESHGHRINERSHTSALRMAERSHIHNRALERDQIRASQRVQTQRAINDLRLQQRGQLNQIQNRQLARRSIIESSTSGQPIGPQVSQGTGSVGGIILRIFIALIAFSVLYLVLTNSNQTSGIIKGVGTGLVGLSSDKTLFVKTKTG